MRPVNTYVYNNHVRFHHNSDLSGYVEITVPTDGGHDKVSIPAEAILEFVAQYVLAKRIAKAEAASWQEILGVHP